MSLIEDTKIEEGLVLTVYKDILDFDTIGYGTKLPLTQVECEWLLNHRMDKVKKDVLNNLHYLNIRPEAWEMLYAMAYQMGVNGLLGFRKMIAALRVGDYKEASRQMLDSLWARQTPERAKRLADRIKKL